MALAYIHTYSYSTHYLLSSIEDVLDTMHVCMSSIHLLVSENAVLGLTILERFHAISSDIHKIFPFIQSVSFLFLLQSSIYFGMCTSVFAY